MLAELGTYSHQAHRDVLQQCVDSKIDVVGVCGEEFGQAALESAPKHSKIKGMYCKRICSRRVAQTYPLSFDED